MATTASAPPPRRRHPWPEVARRLAAQVPRDRLHPRTMGWIQAHARSRRRWGVAVSGGADSVALVLLLWAHWPERRDQVLVLHFNHRLRGRAAAADARFCRDLAGALGLPCGVGEWTDAPAQASEAEARRARRAFFGRELKAARAQALFLGHQRDDVAETMLMRLARGSGTAGLAAPRPVHRHEDGTVHLRPLLSLARAELAEALRQAGGTWRVDASNASEAFFRNRLRRHVLPAWEQAAGRDAAGGAALARERLEEDDEALEAWLDELAPLSAEGDLLLDRLAGRPLALWRRALHRWLLHHPHCSDLSRHGFEQLLSKARAGQATRFSLGARGFAQIRSSRIVFHS